MDKKNILSSKTVASIAKSYREFCKFFWIKTITSSSSAIIDYYLASYPKRVTQCGVVDIGLSDHQLIFYSRIKRGSHKQIKFYSFKHCLIDFFKHKLSKLDFPNYQNYNDINKVDNDFIQKIMGVIDNVVPIKQSWISIIQQVISYKK